MDTKTLDHRASNDHSSGNWELHPTPGAEGASPISPASDQANNREIEAYRKGKEVGHIEGQQEGHRQIRAMLSRIDELHKDDSADLAYRVLSMLNSHSYQFNKTHLRITGLEVYDILIEVDEQAFVSDDFLMILTAVSEIEREARSESFYPTINFITINFDEANRINYQALIGDGYIYHLSPAA